MRNRKEIELEKNSPNKSPSGYNRKEHLLELQTELLLDIRDILMPLAFLIKIFGPLLTSIPKLPSGREEK